MRMFWLVDVDQFDEQEEKLTTAQQLAIGGADAEPYTSLELTTRDFAVGYSLWTFTHEVPRRKIGRAYGRPETFNVYFERIQGSMYYSPGRRLMVWEGSGPVISGAIRRLSRRYGSQFSVRRGKVDFAKVMERAANITGSYFGNLRGNVTSVSLHGSRVDVAEDFHKYSEQGELSALQVSLDIAGRGTYSLLITRNRGIEFYDTLESQVCLELLEDIKPLLSE